MSLAENLNNVVAQATIDYNVYSTEHTQIVADLEAELGPTVPYDGEKFCAVLRMLVCRDSRWQASSKKLNDLGAQLARATADQRTYHDELFERQVISSEAQSQAFVDAEARNKRYDLDNTRREALETSQ